MSTCVYIFINFTKCLFYYFLLFHPYNDTINIYDDILNNFCLLHSFLKNKVIK